MALAWQGRLQEAIWEIEKARQLDPLSNRINANVAQILFWAHDYDRALLQCQKTLELEPNVEKTHRILGTIYLQKGAYQSAISEFQKAVDLAPGDTRPLLQLAYGYGVTGQKEKALNIVRRLEKSSLEAYVSRASVAAVYLALGEKNEALASLEKAILEHEAAALVTIKVDPEFDSLRSDPRFSEMLRRRGLSQ
jgi:Flp pilus assembly protein TadD